MFLAVRGSPEAWGRSKGVPGYLAASYASGGVAMVDKKQGAKRKHTALNVERDEQARHLGAALDGGEEELVTVAGIRST